MKNIKIAKNEFLLEIGTEELPSAYIPPVLTYLRSSTETVLKESRLAFDEIEVFGTPNRLVIHLKGLPPRQEGQREKVTGPSKEAAFDKDGKPTQACLGFLKSKGADIKDISIESTPRGKYTFIERAKESLPAKTILANLLPKLISTVRFPKVMKWDSSEVRFARPVRSLLALYGSEIIDFKFGLLASSKATRIPRYASITMQSVNIKSAKDYFTKLKNYGAVLDQDVRQREIISILKAAAKKHGAADNFNSDLIETVNYLVESPVGFVGEFKKEYLHLPVEVLESSMAKNQKIFLLKDDKGKALPYFVGIINGRRKDASLVRRTFEAILNAKLKDSVFFLAEDQKVKLEDRVEGLKGVVFQAKLGTMHDRVLRLQKLSLDIADSMRLANRDAVRKNLERAAYLSKSDLVTQMVKEFPDLQGIIGREYAKRANEEKDVYAAIYEHYLPKGPQDPLPSSDVSCILAIADKIDTITGFFAIGLIPTGSEDPYGLRRASLGLVKILLEKKYPISLDDLTERAFNCYGNTLSCDKNAVKSQITSFQKDRLKYILLDKKFKDDIIDAVLCPGIDRFDRFGKKIEDLSSITQTKYFLEAAKVVERLSNILKSVKDIKESALKIRAEHFKEPLERELWEIYEKNKARIDEKIEAGDYAGATKAYAEAFASPIHLFFEKVVVNADDQNLRLNRLALLKAILSAYVDKVADLSKIKLQ